MPQRSFVPTYRTPAEPEPEAAPPWCSVCGGLEHADLREDAVLEVLAERGEQLASKRTRRHPGLRSVLVVVVALASYLLVPIPWAPVLIAAVGFTFVGGSTPRSRTASRWHHPPAPSGRRRRAHVGVVRAAAGEGLVAPLTGRPCLAYEIAVRDEDPEPALPPYLLLEQHAVDLCVGTERISADELRLAGPRDRVHVDSAALASFLRTRGLVLRQGARWVVTETIVPADTRARLRRHTRGVTLELAA